jgi:L,D-peptidoglycan transpeptidase YkuD (ErfK/YbiS/YcfS/YnhG family)
MNARKATSQSVKYLRVIALSRCATRGTVIAGALRLPCALGRTGRRAIKWEGDGASPCGQWPIRRVVFRRDRWRRPRAGLPIAAIRPTDGWCDAPSDPNYNRPVKHPAGERPYSASAERLWRDDHVYDVIVIIGYNDRKRRRGAGSAIFMHISRPGYAPTEGCIALSHRDILRVLPMIGRNTRLVI